ncbi:uncharacterized protein LOC134540496 [Bacillus rossius redtenbacheri]|uniref:uncharacterized protein LOC134540496 n=1 Tax=Bacillus rossius redtenbacheri TaxID=93214 RepID=UPI002FDE148F
MGPAPPRRTRHHILRGVPAASRWSTAMPSVDSVVIAAVVGLAMFLAARWALQRWGAATRVPVQQQSRNLQRERERRLDETEAVCPEDAEDVTNGPVPVHLTERVSAPMERKKYERVKKPEGVDRKTTMKFYGRPEVSFGDTQFEKSRPDPGQIKEKTYTRKATYERRKELEDDDDAITTAGEVEVKGDSTSASGAHFEQPVESQEDLHSGNDVEDSGCETGDQEDAQVRELPSTKKYVQSRREDREQPSVVQDETYETADAVRARGSKAEHAEKEAQYVEGWLGEDPEDEGDRDASEADVQAVELDELLLTVKSMPPDGNSLFAALAHQTFGVAPWDPGHREIAGKLRVDAVRHLAHHPMQYWDQLLRDVRRHQHRYAARETAEQQVAMYVDDLALDGFPAGHAALQALADLVGCDVVLYDEALGELGVRSARHSISHRAVLLLRRQPASDGSQAFHFDSVLDVAAVENLYEGA